MEAQLTLLRDVDRLIADGFLGEVGKTITVAFTDGPLDYRILAVKDGVIEAERTLVHLGKVQRRIRPGELTAKERYLRLGEEKTPQRNLLRGLLLLEVQRPKTAEPWFADAGGPLGLALAALAHRLAEPPAPPAPTP